MRFTLLFSVVLVLACLTGCYRTTTHAKLEDSVRATQGNSFPSRLIHVGFDHKYNYYHVENDFSGVTGQYRVLRVQPETDSRK
jgi:hypothetical protein